MTETLLFNPVHDRQQTQLAYKIRHYPWPSLSAAAKEMVYKRHLTVMPRSELLAMIPPDCLTKVLWNKTLWTIYWQYNNIPTEEEWNTRIDLLQVEFRVSPAIPNGGCACILASV